MADKINTLSYSTHGKGTPVVFLHGFLESKEIWNQLIDHLPFQSICIDLPGHGASGDVDFEGIPEVVPLIRQVLDELNVEEFDVVGHSMGGYVALELKKQIKNCRKVILLNSNFWSDSPEKKHDRERVATMVVSNKGHFIREVIPHLFSDADKYQKTIENLINTAMRMSGASIAQASLAMKNRNGSEGLIRKSGDDICVIQGEDDPIMPIDKMKDEIKDTNVQLYVVNSGHMALIETCHRVVEIINEVLSTHESE